MDITTKVTGSNLTASEFMQIVTELETLIQSSGIALSSGTLNQATKAISDYASGGAFYVDSGAADAYACAPVGSKLGLTSYADGATVSFIVGNTNTGASTINVNSLGAKSIVDNSGYALTAGALESGDVVTVKFDNSNNFFRLIDSKFTRNPIGFRVLDTKHELASADFPDTTGLYGWHNNATGAWADEDWIGGEALTEVGAIGTATDIFGTANTYIDFDGANDALYSAGTAFDAINESFSTGGWFKFERTGTNQALVMKSEADNTDRSFALFHDNAGTRLKLQVWYDNLGNSIETYAFDSSDTFLLDGNFHHIIGVYDQLSTCIKVFVDGKCVSCKKDANLATRNNGTTSELCFGGTYDTAVGLTNAFDGKIEEIFYKKSALTSNEIRKIYAASSQRFVTEETSNLRGSVVSIHDGRRNNGKFYNFIGATYALTTSWAIVTGQSIDIPESGIYKIKSENNMQLFDSDSTDGVAFVRLYDGVSAIPNTAKELQNTDGDVGTVIVMPFNIEICRYFAAGTTVSLQAIMNAGDNCAIKYSSGNDEGYISWEKID
ncbi:MAG: hypothetical protein JSU91_01825 [Thermoplasmatales archaeon]|nr:MAG: hypothetical protein JSU91_01825 [Thermoplasmatales archaeon]